MKHIAKQAEPEDFRAWKATFPDATYSDLGHDRLFPGAQRARLALRSSLLDEQKGLCCYCETRIDSGDFHVEHFRPKDSSLYPELQLTYSNLHASCHKVAIGSADETCGHKKGNEFSENIISPLDPECASHFQFDNMGGISSTDEKGIETIAILNLNSVLLRRSRKRLIEEFEDMDDEDFEQEISYHLNPDANPLGEFYTTIEYLYKAGLLH